MLHIRTIIILAIATLLAAVSAHAQTGRNPASLGYVYPAGGQQGQTLDITIGGQRFNGAKSVNISGQGITAEILEHDRPLNGKENVKLRELWRKATEKYNKAGEKPKNRWQAIRQNFLQLAKEDGVPDKQVAKFELERKQRNDPKRQLNPQIAEALIVRLTIAPDAPLTLRKLRVTTRQGVSNPLNFYITPYPHTNENEPNNQPVTATAIPTLPVVINGQIMPGDVDHFHFNATADQQIVIRAYARDVIPYLADAVPGWFQAVVDIKDAQGNEVAYVDDYLHRPDPVILFQPPADGHYTLSIRDSIYRGREDFVYRVVIGELPFITSIFPLGGSASQTVNLELQGWNLPEQYQQVSLDTPGAHQLFTNHQLGLFDPVLFQVSELSQMLEDEQSSKPQNLAIPIVANGRINPAGDTDVYRIHVTAGQTIVAEVTARRLNSPLDSIIKLTDEQGNLIASNDDTVDPTQGLVTHHADSYLAAKIEKTGNYLLHIADTQSAGSPAHAYQLRISQPIPNFALRVVPSIISARGGGTVPVTIHAIRKDNFDSDINLSLAGAPKDFQLQGATIPAGQSKTQFTLSIPPKTENRLTTLTLQGHATANNQTITRTVVAADDLMQAFIYHHLVEAGNWQIEITPSKWKRVESLVTYTYPLILQPNTTTQLQINPTVHVKADTVELELNNPPAGISLAKVEALNGNLILTLKVAPVDKLKATRGNLIFNAYIRQPRNKNGKSYRYLLGTLPAIQYEIAAP